MSVTIRATAPAPKSGMVHRLKDRWMAGQYRGAVRAMQLHAPTSLADIIAEASPMLEPVVAAEIERLLRTGGAPFVSFANTLMPRMRASFGVTEAQLATLAPDSLAAAEKRCNACSQAARCWTALRARASSGDCRAFCPNAPVFDELVREREGVVVQNRPRFTS